MKISKEMLIFLGVFILLGLSMSYLKFNSDSFASEFKMNMNSRSLASVKPLASVKLAKQDLESLAKKELVNKSNKINGKGKQDLENFLSSYSGGKIWTIQKQSSGLPYYMSGALISGLKNNSYAGFKKDLLTAMNLESAQLADSKAKPAGPEQLVDESKQLFKGYVVEGAQLRIFFRKSDHSIFLISSTLKELGEPNLEIIIPKERVEADLKEKGFLGVTAEKVPVIFSEGRNDSQLAWVFFVKMADSKQGHRKLLVSTYDGSVLQDIYIGMN